MAELALGAGGGDALAESDAKAKVREDPLQVEKLLAEAQEGRLPMAVQAELATATATATFNIKDKRDGLAQLAADATAAKEKSTFSRQKKKHEEREKALSAQRDEAQGQLDRITAVAKPLNQNAMGALMPLVATSNHKYDSANAKLSGEDRSTHLPAVHELCKSINAAKPSAAPPPFEKGGHSFRIVQVPSQRAKGAIRVAGEDGDDPTNPVYLLRVYFDAVAVQQLLIQKVEAALGPMQKEGKLRIKRAPLKAVARAMVKTQEENGGNFSLVRRRPPSRLAPTHGRRSARPRPRSCRTWCASASR